MKFCPKCGSQIRRLPNKKDGQPKFCTRCGAILTSEEAPKEPGLAGCFPYRSMRPFQQEVLNQVEATLAARKKFIILEAPVGFGKSPVAAALGLCARARTRTLASSHSATSTGISRQRSPLSAL